MDKNDIRQARFTGSTAVGELKDGRRFHTLVPDDPSLMARLVEHNVDVTITPALDISVLLAGLLASLLLGLMVVGAAIHYIGPRGEAPGERTAPFGRSRARLLSQSAHRTTFEDVAGVEEALQDLQEIVEFLRDPGKFQRLGARIPRGVLLVGSPGPARPCSPATSPGSQRSVLHHFRFRLRRDVRRRRRDEGNHESVFIATPGRGSRTFRIRPPRRSIRKSAG